MRKVTNMETIIKEIPTTKKLPKILKVAAYTRVSANKDEAYHSLSAQVGYYNDYIYSHKGWSFVGVYSDKGRTGTKSKRNGFQSLLQDANDGKIDLIITKSVSRFARNVVVLLKTIRELTKLGIDVYFEEQKVHSISKDGEFLLTVIALYAEMEAKSASNNMLWKIHKTFEQGKIYSMTILGYRLVDGSLVVVPEEAKTVKLIFKLSLEGYGAKRIANYLNEHGHKTRYGGRFIPCNVLYILKNSVYTGDITLQKTYRKNISERRSFINKGERTRYEIEDNHDALIDRETFKLVQKRLADRCIRGEEPTAYAPFRMMLVCSHCGTHYGRHKGNKPFYSCTKSHTLGKVACPGKPIPEHSLIKVTNEVLGIKTFNESLLREKVKRIIVNDNHELIFQMKDGSEISKIWEHVSRSKSWTPEMKDKARAKYLARTGGNKGE